MALFKHTKETPFGTQVWYEDKDGHKFHDRKGKQRVQPILTKVSRPTPFGTQVWYEDTHGRVFRDEAGLQEIENKD